MKKLIALLLAAVIVLSLAACQKSDDKSDKETSETTETTEATEATEATEDTEATEATEDTEMPKDTVATEVTEDTEATEATEATEDTEATEATEATEDTVATEATEATEDTEATETTEPFVPEIGEGVFSKTSYTATDSDLVTRADEVIATVGDAELTMSQLQVFYWMNIYSFLNQYSYYLEYFGLDITQPLDQQECPQSGGTWQQYFLEEALNSWHAYQSLALEGTAQQIPMEEEFQTELDSIDENLENAATEGNHESVDVMLQTDIGPGVTQKSYKDYLTTYSAGLSYYNHCYNNIEITDEMIETYFTENEETLKESEITKDSGKLVDVRHILLTPEGGTTGEDGSTTYSDEEWAACEEAAQAILDLWLAGDKTEESFATLANEHSTDPGSNTNGGLYEDVATGDMVEEFDAWCFDETRKIGDSGLVKTPYGYHVMFYSGDEALWIHECRDALLNEKVNEFITAAAEAHPLTIDYEKIILGYNNLAATE